MDLKARHILSDSSFPDWDRVSEQAAAEYVLGEGRAQSISRFKYSSCCGYYYYYHHHHHYHYHYHYHYDDYHYHYDDYHYYYYYYSYS